MKQVILKMIAPVLLLVWGNQSLALDIFGRDAAEGGHGVKDGLELLYTFEPSEVNAASKLISAKGGASAPFDLQVFGSFSSTGAVRYQTDRVYDPISATQVDLHSVNFNSPALIRSVNRADSLVNSCGTSNEMTIEMWLKNDSDDQPPMGYVSSRSILSVAGASNRTAFSIDQDYDGTSSYSAFVRNARHGYGNTDNNGFQGGPYRPEDGLVNLTSGDNEDNKVHVKDKIQHVMMTRDATGYTRLYVSTPGTLADPFRSNIPYPRDSIIESGNLSNWAAEMDSRALTLNLGNEPTFADTASEFPRVLNNTAHTSEDQPWRGSIYLIAVYCKAHTPEQVLGDGGPGARFAIVRPEAVPVDADIATAVELYKRMTGVGLPPSAPIISGDPSDPSAPYMAKYVAEGRMFDAANLATQDDNFFNITVRDFAKRMSTRDETVATPLNDFVATVIGVARDDDELNAKDLLSGNFFYMAPNKAVPNDIVRDVLKSNNHYEALEDGDFNLAQALERVNQQYLYSGTGDSYVPHNDPAGIITSRAFMGAHAVAGTNRRPLEFTFRAFMCVAMEEWSNASGPDDWVGADVDRLPGGDATKFNRTCRGCHSNMDGMRGAFAKFHFNNGYVKYADVLPVATSEDNEDESSMFQNPPGIAGKMNRNAFTVECSNPAANPSGDCRVGRWVASDEWKNHADLGLNEGRFGWKGAMQGYGVRQFGKMIADSDQFATCLTKRAFRSVCKRDAETSELAAIRSVASQFQADNYNLRRLFARVAATRECMGDR